MGPSRQEAFWRLHASFLPTLRRLIGILWATSPRLVLASGGLRLVRATIPLGQLWVGKLTIDAIVIWISRRSGTAAHIWMLLALDLALTIAEDALGRASTLCESLLGDLFSNSVSLRLMRRTAELDLALFENPVFHDKLERARRQTGRLGLIADLLTACYLTCCLISVSLGLVAFAPGLLILLVFAVLPSFFGETRYSTMAYAAIYSQTPARRMVDYIRSLGVGSRAAKEIRMFDLGAHLTECYRQLSEAIFVRNRALAIRRAIGGSSLIVLSMAGYYTAQAVLLMRTLYGPYSIGTFNFLVGSFSRARSYVERIFSTLKGIGEEVLFCKDLFEVLDLKPHVCSSPKAIGVPRPIRRGIEFRDVSFAYPGADRLAINALSFCIQRHSKLAIIGENGSGKTTLIKLLTRLYDPTHGCILLDGVDLRDYDLKDLRKQVGVIFQDYVRYDLSIRQNIGFGCVDLLDDRARILTAARNGLADDLISRLPAGLDQMLGTRFDGGVDLSGGEWQKLALARAFMCDAQILVLDEPTATLDARAEFEVFKQFAEVSVGRTSVLISHRFSTVRMVDEIIVMADGGIEERGTHEELQARGGRYAELFELQAASYR